MKSFTSYLIESNEKTFDFKIKIANDGELSDDIIDRIEHALAAFEINKMGKPKHLPMDKDNLEFPNLGLVDVYLFDVSLKYPCIDEQVKATISTQARLPAANIKVRSATAPDDEPETVDDTTNKKKDVLLTSSELHTTEEGQPLVGQKRIDSLLKDLESDSKKRKVELGGSEKPSGKTTNETPAGTQSVFSKITRNDWTKK